MKKTLILVLALIASITTTSYAQILYRISGNELKSPSYIVGTYHFAPASFADSIPGIHQAMDETTQVCGELDLMDALKPENSARLMQAQLLPEGVTLSSLFTADQLERLNALLREVMGSDLNDEAVAAQMEKMNPVAISTTLTTLSYIKQTKSFNPLDLIDQYFQTQALQNGKAVKGFETVDFQMSVLFNAPLQKQVDELMCTVDHFEAVMEMTNRIINAYFSQDLKVIEEVLEDEAEFDCSNSPEDMDILINNRNRNWVEVMPAMMTEQPTLFVVGAGHLGGEQGVLKLLEKAGYVVEGVR